MFFKRTLAAVVWLLVASHLADTKAAIVTFGAVQDNTLYENPTGAFSNGAGDYFFAGRSSQPPGSSIRRGLIQFDLAGMVPAGATINSVTLTLNLNRASAAAGTQDVSLHKVTTAWGEGTSDATGEEGGGAAATIGDATWIHSSNPVLWTNVGGDFVAAASDTQSLNANGNYNWSSPAMVTDVQSWVNDPSTNFGWLLRGNEATIATSMRFASHENAVGAPSLSVDFTAVPEPSQCLVLLAVLGFQAVRRRR